MLVDFKSKMEVIHVNLSICYLLPRDLTAGGCFNRSLLRFCCGRSSASVSGRSTNSEGVTIREAQWMLR
jgi:hypothetical protein